MASTDPNNPATYYMNLPTAMTISAFAAIAWVNTIELQFRIFMRFKRYTGLYFWALFFASWGCALHALGFIMLDFDIIKEAWAAGLLLGIPWWWMVTGQSLVLYSRLHLVVRNKRKVRWVLIMIITNFFILHIPIMILSQVAYSDLPTAGNWLTVYNVYEKVQMTGFTIQETIISGLYLWETKKILAPGAGFQKKKTRDVMMHLIWVNILILFFDLALLSTEYANLFSIQTVFKAAIYSLKLRFEFVVLNQLMDLVSGRDTLKGSNNGYESGTNGSVPLDTMNAHKSKDWAVERRSTIPDSYSVFASKGNAKRMSSVNADGVLRTTEVTIHGSPKLTEAEHDEEYLTETKESEPLPDHAITIQTAHSPPSPTSSKVEFAKEGF